MGEDSKDQESKREWWAGTDDIEESAREMYDTKIRGSSIMYITRPAGIGEVRQDRGKERWYQKHRFSFRPCKDQRRAWTRCAG